MLDTMGDLLAIYRDLPEHRREPMLAEICRSIRYQAAYADLLEACGGGNVEHAPGTWTDDGEANISIPTTVNGEEVFRLDVGRPA